MRDGRVAEPAAIGAPARAGAGFDGLDADAAFFAAWLNRQCGALAGTRAGVVLRAAGSELQPAAAWPVGRAAPADLTRIAERAANAAAPVIAWVRRPGAGGLQLMIGAASRPQGALAAVIALVIDVAGGIDSVNPDAIAEQLLMGGGWLEARLARGEAREAAARIERASVAMDIVAVASVERRPSRTAAAVVNELAVRLKCDRVSIGLASGRGIKLKALSHAATFQERSRIVDDIGNAMEECLAQAASVAHPPTAMTRARIAVAHRDLAGRHAGGAAASVLLPAPDRPAGVLTFERANGPAFDEETLLLAETAAALLGPVIAIQAGNDRWVAGRIVDMAQAGLAALFGAGRPALKLAAVVAVVAVAVLSVASAEYRVTARSVIEGEVQRASVAPFDGFIASSSVRPGDRVRAGDVLAVMDDRELVLDRARAWADVEKARRKYDEAVAKHDRPGAAGLAAQIEQGEALLALTDSKLQRARIQAPIDGLVVSGDLSQLLGTPVERGKTLFEIAPLDQYRVVLRVDERELGHVAPGQRGRLVLSGMPADQREFTVTRVTPIAEAKEGRNEFRVEARLDEPPGEALRPGMEGIGKVETGPHKVIWVWTHGFIDWLRLTAWKWMP